MFKNLQKLRTLSIVAVRVYNNVVGYCSWERHDDVKENVLKSDYHYVCALKMNGGL